ncbi:MAG: hypothetical protein Q4C79_00600 [Neisseria sp.]|uniref:hypothetical protein n=1 Tax=Neisseria sp. TaxID=192066 RepID=UPI0026DC4AD8|nr:hypothetical protein [Neisseria sp.]MDO4247457.1 hypothetical protein [Neisseria sp.]
MAERWFRKRKAGEPAGILNFILSAFAGGSKAVGANFCLVRLLDILGRQGQVRMKNGKIY